MTPEMYQIIASMLGAHLALPLPTQYSPRDNLPALEAAIYVGLSTGGRVEYVGSVRRPGSLTALIDRLNEHDAAERWTSVVIFPLKHGTPYATVRQLEGAVGDVLWPTQSRRLPRSGLPRRPQPSRRFGGRLSRSVGSR